MKDSPLLGVDVTGAVVAATCCATPILVVLLGGLGLSAWAAKLDYVLLPVLAACLMMIGYGSHRRRQGAVRRASEASSERKT